MKPSFENCLEGIYPVSSHTKHIGPGSTFVVIQGQKEDGTRYIPEAVYKGAATIVVDQQVMLDEAIGHLVRMHGVTVLRVEDPRKALAQLSAAATNHAHAQLRIIGITGTKGKTTSAFLLFHMLQHAGYSVALLSTIYNKIGDQSYPTQLTTQQPDYLHQFFQRCYEQQVTYVVMEVAAQALSLHRTYGLQFCAALFTNFSQEHGEFYDTQRAYFCAKKKLFDQVANDGLLVINADDKYGPQLNKLYRHAHSFGFRRKQVTVAAVCQSEDPVALQITYDANPYHLICPTLKGAFNAYNVVGAATVSLQLGISMQEIQESLLTFQSIPGRLEEYLLPNGARAFIDYAHNPASYHAVLSLLRSMTQQLIVVFGCGGERDRAKRPRMGSIVCLYADHIIITSDNPRSEPIAQIIDDICSGIGRAHAQKIVCEIDREHAIQKAYRFSQSGSIILLLGKGPDEYQLIGTEKVFFSEKLILRALTTASRV